MHILGEVIKGKPPHLVAHMRLGIADLCRIHKHLEPKRYPMRRIPILLPMRIHIAEKFTGQYFGTIFLPYLAAHRIFRVLAKLYRTAAQIPFCPIAKTREILDARRGRLAKFPARANQLARAHVRPARFYFSSP